MATITSQRLAHRVTFERPNTATDAYGHRLPGWEYLATVWAAVRPVGSTERLAAAQMQSGQTHVVTTRYSELLACLRGQCRMVYQGRTFNLVGYPRVVNEGRKFIVFDCTEGGTDGH